MTANSCETSQLMYRNSESQRRGKRKKETPLTELINTKNVYGLLFTIYALTTHYFKSI